MLLILALGAAVVVFCVASAAFPREMKCCVEHARNAYKGVLQATMDGCRIVLLETWGWTGKKGFPDSARVAIGIAGLIMLALSMIGMYFFVRLTFHYVFPDTASTTLLVFSIVGFTGFLAVLTHELSASRLRYVIMGVFLLLVSTLVVLAWLLTYEMLASEYATGFLYQPWLIAAIMADADRG